MSLLSSLNPMNWSVGGVSVKDVVTNPLLNPVGVIGSIPVQKATAMSGIGGPNGLDYSQQLLIGGAVGTGVAAAGALPAASLPAGTSLPSLAALPAFDAQSLIDKLKQQMTPAAPAAPVIVNSGSGGSGSGGGNSQLALFGLLGLGLFVVLKKGKLI